MFPKSSYEHGNDDHHHYDHDFDNDDGIDGDSGSGCCSLNTYYVYISFSIGNQGSESNFLWKFT